MELKLLREHPLITLIGGVVIGMAFGAQLRRLPVVSKIPVAGS